ncbi:MAG: hypothetical protein OXN83_03180, partial [Oligoflexia bacterium]|nr:hypothetical protein [Oligoflexia bacterium]
MSFYFFRRYFLSSRSGSLIKLISWLCLAGITVSITALILIISIMGGFGEAIKSRLLSKQAHLTVEFNNNPFLLKKNTHSNKKESLFFDKINPELFFLNLTKEQKKQIKKFTVFETQELILKSKDGFKGISAIGYSEKKWNKKLETAVPIDSPTSITINNSIPTNALPLKAESQKGILLSHKLSLETGLSVNDTVTFIPLTGLLLPPNLPPPIKDFKVKAILPPSEKIQENFSIYYKQGLMDFGNFSNINYKAEIQFYQPEKVKDYQKAFKQYKTQNWIEQNSILFFALKLEKFIMTLFLILALVISCLGVSSALLLLMTQKREDIAILQAIGMSQKDIIKTFTQMGLYLSTLGIALGAIIGILGTLLLKYNHFNILPEMYQDRTIPA